MTDHHLVTSSPVPTHGVLCLTLGRVDFELNTSRDNCTSQFHVSVVYVTSLSCSRDESSSSGESGESKSFEVFQEWFERKFVGFL